MLHVCAVYRLRGDLLARSRASFAPCGTGNYGTVPEPGGLRKCKSNGPRLMVLNQASRSADHATGRALTLELNTLRQDGRDGSLEASLLSPSSYRDGLYPKMEEF